MEYNKPAESFVEKKTITFLDSELSDERNDFTMMFFSFSVINVSISIRIL